MSVVRSPTGSGLGAGLSGSDPNLVSGLDASDKTRVIFRNKRKQTDDANHVNEELSDIKKQLSQMMNLMNTICMNQKEFMEKVTADISTIKDQINDIRDVTSSLTADQNAMKLDILQLKTENIEATKTIKTLKSDVFQLKTTFPQPTTTSDMLETMVSEIKEREERSKNIIIVGVSETLSENGDEIKGLDRKEVLKITRILNPDCSEPIYIFGIGKYNSNRHRPIKVCYKTKETAMSLLRNKKNLNLDGIKVFSDQTPQQQMYMKHLKEELKQRSDNGDKDLTIRYIKGVPKITKLLPKILQKFGEGDPSYEIVECQ